MNIKVDELTNAVINQTDLYRAMLQENIDEVFEQVGDKALAEIKAKSQSAGFNDRKYSKGWTKVTTKNKVTGVYHVTIHNKKYYRLTHLLEKGHALPNGGRTRAFPHIAPVQADMDELIVKELAEAIEETQ